MPKSSGRRRRHKHSVRIVLLALFVLWGPIEGLAQSICDRTAGIVAAILAELPEGTACGDVTAQQLAGITELDAENQGIASLTEADFAGLTSLTRLELSHNDLTELPDGFFTWLPPLERFAISHNPETGERLRRYFEVLRAGEDTPDGTPVRVRMRQGASKEFSMSLVAREREYPNVPVSTTVNRRRRNPADPVVTVRQREIYSEVVTVKRSGPGQSSIIPFGIQADYDTCDLSTCWAGLSLVYYPLDIGTAPLPPPANAWSPSDDDLPGSQLLFIADTGTSARDQAGTGIPDSRSVSDLLGTTVAAQKNFISVANTNEHRAVTVLFQYHNDEMKRVLWYLRVLRAGAAVLVDPFDHEIPGTADGEGAGGRVNVKDILFDTIPALSSEEDAGFNSGRFVIAVTAVGANTVDDPDTSDNESNTADTANILFPTFLAKDLHGVDNVDNCGEIRTAVGATDEDNNLEYTRHGIDGANDCSQASDAAGADDTSRNVGDLSIHNYQPLAFNWLTGHHTAAQLLPDLGEGIAWGVNALTRPGISTSGSADAVTTRIDVPYTVLDGANGARLAPKVHGGAEEVNAATDDDNRADDSGAGSPVAQDPTASENNRVVNGGALVWPALYRTAHQEQRVRFLSVADDYGDPGEYQLLAARTLYRIALHDAMGNVLSFPETDLPVFGGLPLPEPPPSLHVLVDGIGVLPNASPADCIGNARVEGWSLADLTDIVPSAAAGGKDFAGLDAPVDPETNASPGWVRFHRTQVTCTRDFGDGDPSDSLIEIPDGVPTQDKRSFIGGTVVVEKETANRTFVTAGQVVVRLLTPHSAFGASWWLGED